MPRKPNYGFEKRQRELEKKNKKEEKRLKRLEAGNGTGEPDEGGEATGGGEEG